MDSTARESLLLHALGWWQFAVCLFAFAALMTIWWHLGRKKGDHGQVWLAVSVMCWSLSGLCEVYYSNVLSDAADLQVSKSDLASLKSILSLLNSFFILMALPFFRYLPGRFRDVIQSEYWKYIIGIPFLLAIVPIIAKYVFHRQYNFINDLDVYYSILTLVFLGAVLWESFAKRNLKLLSVLSLICIIITFVAQLYKPLDNTLNQLIFSAIFKSCLIMIFFALAMSWVKELVEETLTKKEFNPSPETMILRLANRKVFISGIWSDVEDEISLSSGKYELLELFVNRKINQDHWLTIKPKDAPEGKSYDINSENEITRLIKSITYGIIGDEIRKSFIERNPGKVKLKQLPENLTIEK